MTREEAIALLNEQYETCKRIYDCSADQRKSYPNVPQFMEALGMALSALRSVSREQAEKVWRGEWQYHPEDYDELTWTCSRCGEVWTLIDGTPDDNNMDFCPACGSPMTDEAVDMMLERWKEAVDGEAKTD